MRKTASIASILIGIVLVAGGVVTWVVVSSTLADQRITVAEDADCMAGRTVRGPLTAYCQARIIDQHALNATGGQTFAELDREDPLRQVAQNAAFLQSSLFTSVVAFGIAGQAVLMGVLFVLIGLGIRDVAQRTTPLEGRHSEA